MRFVSQRVDGRLGQQDSLAVRRHTLEVQRVEVTSLSRQVVVVDHQPNLTAIFTSDRDRSLSQYNREISLPTLACEKSTTRTFDRVRRSMRQTGRSNE